MKRQILILIFLLFSIPFFAQKKIDSLLTALKTCEKKSQAEIYCKLIKAYQLVDTAKAIYYAKQGIENERQLGNERNEVKLLMATANFYFANNNTNMALEYFIEAQKLGENLIKEEPYDSLLLKDMKGLYYSIGEVYVARFERSKARDFFIKSLETAKKAGDMKMMSLACLRLGIIYRQMSNFDSALSYSLKSLKICESINDEDGIAYANINLGNFYYFYKEPKTSLAYFQKGLDVRLKQNDKNGIAACYTNMGNAYWQLNELDKTIDYYEKALEIRKALGDEKATGVVIHNIGTLYYKKKEYSKSIAYYKEALDIYIRVDNKWSIANTLNNIGESNRMLKNNTLAKEYFERGLQMAKEINALDLMQLNYNQQAELYESLGDFKKALAFYKQYTTIKDSLFNTEKSNQIVEMQTKYDTEKKENEIKLRDVIIAKDKAEINKQQILNITFLIVIGVIALFSLLLYRLFHLKNKAYIQLEQKNKEVNRKNLEIEQQREEIIAQSEQLEKTNFELEKLSIVASKTDNSVIIADKFGDIEWVNDGFVKVFGYTKDEYIELKGRNIIHSNPNEQKFQNGIQQHSSVSFETLDQTKNGNKIWIQSTVTPIFDENLNLQKIIIINSDVTRIKIAEEEIKQQREEILAQRDELERINKTLELRVQEELKKNREKEIMMVQQSRQATMGEMIGNIAHQWRQPLNAVGVFVQNFKEAYNYGELTEQYLTEKIDKIMQIIKFMSQTIEDFRNFFRTDKEKKLFNVKDAIVRALSFVEGSFKNNNIKVILDLHEGVEINGFPNEFAQVLLNIYNNAKDAFVENKIKERVLIIKSFILDNKTIVSITDNAGGIPEHIIHQIFDPYFTTKDASTGTGLGLYMSKTIIEKNMEGSLTVKNVNNGAEFTILI